MEKVTKIKISRQFIFDYLNGVTDSTSEEVLLCLEAAGMDTTKSITTYWDHCADHIVYTQEEVEPQQEIFIPRNVWLHSKLFYMENDTQVTIRFLIDHNIPIETRVVVTHEATGVRIKILEG